MQITSIKDLPPQDRSRQHARVLRLLFEHGGKQAMSEDYLQLARASDSCWKKPDVSLLLATVRGEDGPALIGASFMAGYGKDAFLIAIHPLYRRKGIGSALLRRQLEELGKIEIHANLSQTALLNLLLKAGLSVSFLGKNPTGRKFLSLNGETKNPVRPPRAPTKEGEILCLFLS
jgi:GNAT superfamily N-acetyltransferase